MTGLRRPRRQAGNLTLQIVLLVAKKETRAYKPGPPTNSGTALVSMLGIPMTRDFGPDKPPWIFTSIFCRHPAGREWPARPEFDMVGRIPRTATQLHAVAVR
ncbi:hypothetical protein AB0I53_40565 [Saccharopolyspora sp. NPDC050389]|uniref:hypothetical protein n=1 Tax=Saccharopolyspora sp. NPDC050389 TaxID=3155516 RepID=UPI0033EE06BA